MAPHVNCYMQRGSPVNNEAVKTTALARLTYQNIRHSGAMPSSEARRRDLSH